MAKKNFSFQNQRISMYVVIAFLVLLGVITMISLKVLQEQTFSTNSNAQGLGANCYASCQRDSDCNGGLICGASGANTKKCVPYTCRGSGFNCQCVTGARYTLPGGLRNIRQPTSNIGTPCLPGCVTPTSTRRQPVERSGPNRGRDPGSICYSDLTCRSKKCINNRCQ